MKTKTRLEFNSKWDQHSLTDTRDVLMRIASNLSDMQMSGASDEKLNLLKKYIFDYSSVLKQEELQNQ